MTSKISILKLIEFNKEYLLSPFSSTVTQDGKLKLWEQIRLDAIAAGDSSWEKKTGKDVRNFWTDQKRRTVTKKEKRGRTGEGRVVFNEVFFLNVNALNRNGFNVLFRLTRLRSTLSVETAPWLKDLH